jgi:hypothetical protein
MLRIRPTPAPRTEVRTKTRRPPRAYIELLSSTEEEFRRTVQDIEGDPLFEELRALGVVRKRGGRGRMPREAYESGIDRQVAGFVKRYGLHDRPGALDRLSEALRREGAASVARRLGAPVAEVRRVARFLLDEPEEPKGAGRAYGLDAAAPPDLEDVVAGTSEVDLSQAMGVVSDFVHRFSLSQHELVADFLHGDDPPDQLARRYRTTEQVIRRVMDAVTFVLTADIVTQAARPLPRDARGAGSKAEVAVVARVYLHGEEPHLHFGEETGYGLRYVIDPGALGELETAEEQEQAEALLSVLRHINQRRSVQCRLVAALFERQKAYFASGDELDLRPVSQAELARELGESQSTISRSVRGRYVETPYGTHELQFYCQRKQDVVLRLSATFPEATDRELQQMLEDRYGCKIARRTVAYHRRAHRR